MVGIAELKDVLAFLVSMGNTAGTVLEDGKVSIIEWTEFAGPVLKLPAAINGLDKVPGELADLDEAERVELLDFVANTFAIPQAEVEQNVEEALGVAAHIWQYVNRNFLKKEEA